MVPSVISPVGTREVFKIPHRRPFVSTLFFNLTNPSRGSFKVNENGPLREPLERFYDSD